MEILNDEIMKFTKDALETFYRFRLGSENSDSKYWKNEKERICRVCGEESETSSHVLEKCRLTGEKKKWKSLFKGGRVNLTRLKKI